MGTREAILDAALAAFDADGYDRSTVAAIRARAGVSNGSFFHFFPTKETLAGMVYLEALRHYHASMAGTVDAGTGAVEGIGRLVCAHVDWVVGERPRARFLFDQAQAEWLEPVREAQSAENRDFGARLYQWVEPRIADGGLRELPVALILSQIVGPAQMFCRMWLAGRCPVPPQIDTAALVSCAVRALVPDA